MKAGLRRPCWASWTVHLSLHRKKVPQRSHEQPQKKRSGSKPRKPPEKDLTDQPKEPYRDHRTWNAWWIRLEKIRGIQVKRRHPMAQSQGEMTT